MSVRKCLAIASLVLLGSVAAPSKASADWLLTPFVGWNFGGSADFLTDGDGDFDDEFEQRANFGVSLAWMGGGIIGFEADLGYTPNFFENTTGPDNFEFGDNSVTTLMANLMIGIPIGGQTGGGFRPYVVGGVGYHRESCAQEILHAGRELCPAGAAREDDAAPDSTHGHGRPRPSGRPREGP